MKSPQKENMTNETNRCINCEKPIKKYGENIFSCECSPTSQPREGEMELMAAEKEGFKWSGWVKPTNQCLVKSWHCFSIDDMWIELDPKAEIKSLIEMGIIVANSKPSHILVTKKQWLQYDNLHFDYGKRKLPHALSFHGIPLIIKGLAK